MAPHPNAPPFLFDRTLLRQRRARAQKMGAATFLLDRVAEDMAERLHAVLRDFAEAIDVLTPDAMLAARLPARLKITPVIAPESGSEALSIARESVDLAVSALAFQLVNDLPGVLAQIRAALKPDGLLLAAMLGGSS